MGSAGLRIFLLLAIGALVLVFGGCWRSSPNIPPNAIFVVEPDRIYPGDEVTFDATPSDDPDGQIVEYRWEFGDGTEGQGQVVVHVYVVPGNYIVRLTVRDDGGATATAERAIEVRSPPSVPGNQPPVARFTYAPAEPQVGQEVVFDASASTDDGVIVSYFWSFGDGGTGSGERVSHRYGAAGTYRVRLVVRDDQGAVGVAEQEVTVRSAQPGPNQPPVARFTYSPENPTAGSPVTFDGRASTDDGTIVSYAWDFGDGTTGTGPVVQHTFYVPGAYTVRLTVVDDQGATASAAETVTVGPPVPPPPPG